MLLATTSAYLLQDVLNRLFYCSKQTGSSNFFSKETITPSFLRFWNWAKKTVSVAKICGGAEMLLKQKPSDIRKWIAQF